MAGRLVWIAAGGAAILAGIAVHSNDFVEISDKGVTVGETWEDRVRDEARDVRRDVRRSSDRISKEEREQLVEALSSEESDRLKITTGEDGSIVVGGDAARELASAVGELVRAEIALAMVNEDDAKALKAAQERRDEADERVNTLKDEVEKQAENKEAYSEREREEMRERIRERIRGMFGRS